MMERMKRMKRTTRMTRMTRCGSSIVLASLILFPPAADAILPASSADDLCPASADPCIVDQVYDVTGPLDFGARKVLIVTGGRLRGQPGVTIDAGALEIAVGLSAEPSIEGDGNSYWGARITIWKACSGDGTTRCLVDDQCASLGLGTCSAGNSGTIVADGMISAAGASPGSVSIRAAGDITLLRRVNTNANVSGASPGDIRIESFQGTVAAAQLTSSSDLGSFDYESGYGGFIEVNSAEDVILSNPVRAWGQGEGGQIDISARHDLLVHSDIIADTGSSQYANGGNASLYAGNDLTLANVPGGDSTQEVGTDGGGVFKASYGYGYWQSGYGGEQRLRAGRHLSLGPNSSLHSQGGPGAKAGYIYLYADWGNATLQGSIRAQGLPPALGGDSGAAGGHVSVNAYEDITLATDAVIDLSSPLGFGSVSIDAPGKVTLDGLIDVRGTATGEYIYGSGGTIRIGDYERGDVTIGGTLRGGGQGYGYSSTIDACRLHLTQGALVKQSTDVSNPDAPGIDIRLGESMVADRGSRILTDPAAGTGTTIAYRDAKKPPVLNGSVSPAPLLVAAPGFEGCPVCGNAEIDAGESCDDGNTTSGDGCRSDCQDEGCLAESPGYPGTPLCDDGIACSQDDCDPVAHTCRNLASCDDSVSCTDDSCELDGCHHVVNDAHCDDGNDCTFDLCNSATGCVFADLTGNVCEDGDYCTAAGSCEQGTCSVVPSIPTSANAIKIKLFDGANNDRLKAQMELPASVFDVNPTVTGARIVIGNAFGDFISEEDLAASDWKQKVSGALTKLRYTSPRTPEGGVSTVAISRDALKDIVHITIRLRSATLAGTTDQSQLSLSMLFGTTPGSDPCITARSLPCESRGTITTCRGE